MDDNHKRIYQAIVEAENEIDAFKLAVNEAENKGCIIPDEVWTRTKKHKK